MTRPIVAEKRVGRYEEGEKGPLEVSTELDYIRRLNFECPKTFGIGIKFTRLLFDFLLKFQNLFAWLS